MPTWALPPGIQIVERTGELHFASPLQVTMGAGGHAEVEFVRPTVDTLQYGQIQLANGLQAILVSDKDADKASAALDVSRCLAPEILTSYVV